MKFGHGSAQHVRAGFRLGSHNDMNFGKGTSSRDTLRDSAKHSVRGAGELVGTAFCYPHFQLPG